MQADGADARHRNRAKAGGAQRALATGGDPRAWAAWSAATLVVVLTSTNPVYRLLVLLLAVNVLLHFRRRDAAVRGLFLTVAFAALLSTLVNTLLSHTGDHVLFSLPDAIPGAGGRITAEAILYGLDVGLGIAAAVLAVAPLSRVLHPHDLLDALPRLLQRTAAVTGAALNLVPAVARNAVDISEAQRLRGGRGTRLRDWHAVAAPILLSALDDSMQLAEAMESRGFGAGPRSSYSERHLTPAAVAVLLAAAAAIAFTVAARAAGLMPDWYPFPTAPAPDVAVLPLVACMLLTLPLVAWRPRS